jgi:Cu+-exporting ATPase
LSQVLFGNEALMQEENVDCEAFKATMLNLAEQGQTPMLLAVNGQVAGIIAVADPIKADSARWLTFCHRACFIQY